MRTITSFCLRIYRSAPPVTARITDQAKNFQPLTSCG